MKRNFFYFAVSALALTACTSEEVFDDATKADKVIRFENVVKKHSRQGDVADLSGTTLSQFQVFGYYYTGDDNEKVYDVFDDVLVTYKNNASWVYEDVAPQYWVPGAHYYFYAYSCGKASETDTHFGTIGMDFESKLTPEKRLLEIKNFVCDATHQHDLIYASNTGAGYAGIEGQVRVNGYVTFNFQHLLSKVNATFKCDFPTGYEVTISNVTIENICNVGDYNQESLWTNVVKRDDAAHVFLLDTSDKDVKNIVITPADKKVKTNSAYVIPNAYTTAGTEENPEPVVTNVILKFNVVVLNNDGVKIADQELTASFSPEWLPGFAYTYNVVVDPSALQFGAISFTTSVNEWGVGNTANDNGGEGVTIDK